MKRSYLALLGGVVVLAVALSVLGRSPRRRTAAVETTAPAGPVVEVTLVLRGGTMTPETVSVEKGSRLILTVTNTGRTPAVLTLPGYDDRLPAIALEPGGSWRGEIEADRPGDDFAWTLDGEPAGRFIVAGSHLVEGHR